MIEDIGADEYKIEEYEKVYILRISSTNNKINLSLSTRNNRQFKNYCGEFTLDDLRRINRVFVLTPTIYDAKEEFKKAIERKKIAISERDDYVHIVFYLMIGTDTSTLSVALPRDETPRIIRLEQNLNVLKLGKDNLSERLAVFEREAEEINRDLEKIEYGNNTLYQIVDTMGQGIPDVSEILHDYRANRQNPNYSSYQKAKRGKDQPYSSARYNQVLDEPYSSAKINNNNDDQPYSSAKYKNNDNDQPYSSARLKNNGKDQPYSSARLNNNNEDEPYSSARLNNNNEDGPYSSARLNNNNAEDVPYSSANIKGTQIDPIKESLNEDNRDSSLQNNIDTNNLAINPSVGLKTFPKGIIKNIIKEPYEIEMVINKIEEKFPGSTYKLLYMGSRDGDSAAEFHSRCDEAEKSLVIVEDNLGNRFGGFTSQDWGGQYLQKLDSDAFIFSINKNKIYDVIPNQNAIGCFPNFGPVFFGCQIRIYDNYLTKGGTTYKKGLNYRTTEDFELTNGRQNFEVKDIEVYEVESPS